MLFQRTGCFWFFSFLTTIAIDQLGAGEARAACPDPGPNQIVVYEHANFAGRCRVLGIGNYPNSSFLSPVPNDSISSVKLGSDVRAALFANNNCVGKRATYEAGAWWNSIGNVNDSVTSVRVEATNGQRVAYRYLGNYPNDKETSYSEDIQGVTHSPTHWYFTNMTKLAKTPLSANLAASEALSGSVGIADFFKDQGYNHYGDPDFAVNPLTGEPLVFVPLEGGSTPLVLAFNADTLALVNYEFLDDDQQQSGWVAIRAGATLVTSNNHVTTGRQGLRLYALDWSNLNNWGDFLITQSRKELAGGDGEAISIGSYMQGGDFSDDGSVLYVVNGCQNCGGTANWFGVSAFNWNTGRVIAVSGNGYGLFNYAYGGNVPDEEPEGLDFGAVPGAPGIGGDLHVLLLNHDFTENDNFWFKHYTRF